MIRSPFFYVGDKYKLMPQLINYFPQKIETFLEPFVGGGSVFLNVNASQYVGNDNNKHIINLHKFLNSYKYNRSKFFFEFEKSILEYGFSASYLGKIVSEDLKKKYKKTYYAVFNKEPYLNLKKVFNQNKDDLMLLYVLLIYGFNHMIRFNNKGDFNLPVGNVDYNVNVFNSLNYYFDFIESQDITFHNSDYKDFLLNRNYGENDFVYFDPPYLISASEYNKGWTKESEIDLLNVIDLLSEKRIKFALSNLIVHKGKENNLLKEWAKKYQTTNITSNYISYHDNSNKETVEVLIKNY